MCGGGGYIFFLSQETIFVISKTKQEIFPFVGILFLIRVKRQQFSALLLNKLLKKTHGPGYPLVALHLAALPTNAAAN